MPTTSESGNRPLARFLEAWADNLRLSNAPPLDGLSILLAVEGKKKIICISAGQDGKVDNDHRVLTRTIKAHLEDNLEAVVLEEEDIHDPGQGIQ